MNFKNLEPTDSLALYFRDITPVSLLTKEQEVELAKKIHAGDIAAREKMINSNLRLVVKISKQFENMGLPLQDLISEGNIGLMNAVDRFNPEKFDNKFSTFACWHIKSKIRLALLTQSRLIRLPAHIGDELHKVYKAKSELEEKLEREPLPEELSKETGIPVYKIKALFDFNSTTSLDELEEAGGELAEEGLKMAYGNLQEEESISEMYKKLKSLSARERKILKMRFGFGGYEAMSLEEVGAVIGLTRERIRQIQEEALETLRKSFKRTSKKASLVIA